MFSVHDVSCRHGDRTILRDVSLDVGDGEKLAVVGANGSGKSTLLQIIARRRTPDSGRVAYPRDARIGYLPQEAALDSRRTVREELLAVFDAIHGHFAEMASLETRMAETDGTAEFDRIARRYSHLQSEIQRLDGYTVEAQVGETAAGLGFTPTDLERPCDQFSGGWRTRIVLAKVLLGRPDILLLDEPTNHLDLESMLWLENWIRGSRASVALVSHERAFMDRLAGKVLELANGEASLYHGNYTNYVGQRSERREQRQRAYDNQQLKIGEIEKFIARFRYNASKAALAQSRVRQLEKIERLDPPPADSDTIHFEFPPAERVNKEVIVLEGASKSFGPLRVLNHFNLALYRADRVAVVGLNGAGKSTLLKLLSAVEPLSTGRRIVGSKVKMEYFEQFQAESLSGTRTVLDETLSAAPLDQSANVRDLLAAFLFRGDDVDKPVSVLSGGEKTRLRLAKMLFSRANCLILDEPTNHLDLASRLTLERALQRFIGAMILVSHDRVFLDRVANKIIEIRDGNLRVFPGNYTDYLNATGGRGFLPSGLADGLAAKREEELRRVVLRPSAIHAAQSSPLPEAGDSMPPPPQTKAQRIAEREQRKTAARRRTKLERGLAGAEQKAAQLEKALEAIHAQMAEPQNATNAEALRVLVQQQRETRAALATAYQEWEQRAAALDAPDSS